MDFKSSLILLCILLLGACALITPQASKQYPDKESQSCADFFSNLERTISTANVIDSEAARIKSFPYLRVNRFLSDFKNELIDTSTFNAWVDRMQDLANEGWLIEINNLPSSKRQKLSAQTTPAKSSLNESIQYCGNTLRKIDLDEEHERQNLKNLTIVPDEYITWQRVVGLYPLTAWLFRIGIDAWHEETNKVYAQTLENLTINGELIRYTPSSNKPLLSPEEVSQIIKASSQNALNIPEPSKRNIQKLFNTFAPIFEIDTVTNDDQIGQVVLTNNMLPKINVDSATVYQHISYTRIASQILLQLNYSIWFPARPKKSTFDMLGGQLDGITWRVTLLPDGEPLLFDTIHNCGCYHLFFPTQHATVSNQTPSLEESVFIPQKLFTPSISAKKVVIRIANSSHYIERVYFNSATAHKTKPYQFMESKTLRSLKFNNGERHSLFGQDGVIHSSKRGERYLFWPMGIPNPGAMRQWGHHATAFVGRRHFDDARLFENYFTIQ